jgi:hypothetical protein
MAAEIDGAIIPIFHSFFGCCHAVDPKIESERLRALRIEGSCSLGEWVALLAAPRAKTSALPLQQQLT